MQKKESRNQISVYKYQILILIIAFVHRFIVFVSAYDHLQDLILKNPDWLTWQYLDINGLIHYLLDSVLFLQQTPPIPNIILAMAAKTFGWPYGTAYALIIFQAMLSIGSTLFLFYFLNLITKKQYLAFFISILFILSTDILILEYNSFGQTFYEQLAMFFLLLAVYFFYKIVQKKKTVYSIGLGLTSGALALTRASYSYFFVIPGFFLFLLFFSGRLGKTKRLLSVFLLCICLTQFIWSGKNYLVYKTFSISTSSWKGLNFAIGLTKVGQKEAFIQSILSEKERYPEWFVTMIEDHGLVHWHPPLFHTYVPQQVQDQERLIQDRLHNTNRSENSIGQRLIGDLYMKAYIRFLIKNPFTIFKKFVVSYVISFWQPIRNYSNLALGPLFVETQIGNSFNIVHVLKTALSEGFADNQYLLKGAFRFNHKAKDKTCFYTIPCLPLLIFMLNIVVIHIAIPLHLLFTISYLQKKNTEKWKERVQKARLLEILIPFMVGCYLYGMVVMNLPEHTENMRFRLSVEPVIWLISTYYLIVFWKLVKRNRIL